jgi:hypothetical protein
LKCEDCLLGFIEPDLNNLKGHLTEVYDRDLAMFLNKFQTDMPYSEQNFLTEEYRFISDFIKNFRVNSKEHKVISAYLSLLTSKDTSLEVI